MAIYQTCPECNRRILMTKYQRLLTNDYQLSTNSYVRIYKQIMQNKAKVKYAKINLSSYITMRYEMMDIWLFRQTKPKQTQLKPKQIQLKPKQTQFQKSGFSAMLICTRLPDRKIYIFLIKYRPKIAENREIMAFFNSKRSEKHEKTVKKTNLVRR